MHGLPIPLQTLDYLGVAVFAVTGALAAARSRHDVVTFAAFAILTGIGGGTLRDLLIRVPVFWVHDSGYIYVCLAAAGLVWLAGERPWRTSALAWFDAVGLAAYAVLGAAKHWAPVSAGRRGHGCAHGHLWRDHARSGRRSAIGLLSANLHNGGGAGGDGVRRVSSSALRRTPRRSPVSRQFCARACAMFG